MVESKLTSARRESSRVCCTTIGTSESNNDEYGVSRGIGSGRSRSLKRKCSVRRGGTKEYGDADMGRLIAGIKNAGGLMRDQRRLRKRALPGDVALRNGPTRLSQHRHFCRPCLLPELR